MARVCLLAGALLASHRDRATAAPIDSAPSDLETATQTAAAATTVAGSLADESLTDETQSDESRSNRPLPATRRQPARLPAPAGAKAMPAPHQVWVNTNLGVVLVDGYVSLNEGLLEMFACPSGTKEHESIVAVHSSAQIVHAALLAVGAEVGHPVRWDPEFEPPTGTEISIEVRWLDEAGHWQSSAAQQWINDLSTKRPMAHHWVFAGSGFWKDEAAGKEFYLAEAGDLVCVSNFSSATLDITVESSQLNDGLLFEANTKNIPPIGTPVRLVFKPKLIKDNSRQQDTELPQVKQLPAKLPQKP